MSFIDFVIGALFMNAMPHLVFGLTNTHFLGMFGYSAKGNILYGIIQFVIGLLLYTYTYGYETLLDNGFLVGGLTILVSYFLLGKFMVQLYGKRKKVE
ncbi:MAG: hypothetical protein AAF617_16515 [Bacteroidota bacterium]